MRSGYQTLPYHADGAAFVQQSRSVGKSVGKSEIAKNFIGAMADTVSARLQIRKPPSGGFFIGAVTVGYGWARSPSPAIDRQK